MPPQKTSDHDTFGYRLIKILKKLNQGEKLDPKALAEEFKDNQSCIQRDLNECFDLLPLEITNGLCNLNPTSLGKRSLLDIKIYLGGCVG